MADEEQKIIFSKNLNKYLSLSNKTQKEVADAIDVSPQTFNTWCQGIALPRMGKVQRLADYFGIGKTDLIDEKPPDPLTPRDERDIEKILDQTREQLLSQEGFQLLQKFFRQNHSASSFFKHFAAGKISLCFCA